MQQFHVTDDGPRPCNAQPGHCPLGGQHFDSKKEAQAAYETINKDKNLSGMNKVATTPDFTVLMSENTKLIVQALSDQGVTPILVGGCVRDVFTGKSSKDIDIEVFGQKNNGDALSYTSLKKMVNRVPNVNALETGASFAVLKVRMGEEDFDISLPRTEKSTGDKHSEYEVSSDSRMSFEEASSRRDFTINSMGYDPVNGRVVDPHGGEQDLKNGVLRHIGPAFSDDPLRCMRAVNFASRFNLTLAPETEKLCKELAPQYKTLSRERIEEEFNKVFTKGKHIDVGLTMMHDIGWSERMPVFQKASRDDLKRYGEILNKTPVALRKSVLNYAMAKDGYGECIQFIESSTKARSLAHAFSDLANSTSHKDVVANHRRFKTMNPHISNAELLESMKSLNINVDRFKALPEKPIAPVLTGKILAERGFAPGPEMGKTIRKAQDIQDEFSIYDVDILLHKAISEK